MAEYVYIEHGDIVEYRDTLPRNWRNVSGLYLLAENQTELNALGWFRVTKQAVSYDDNTHSISHYQYTVSGNTVTETPVIVEKPQEQILSFQQTKDIFLNDLRIERNKRLLETDWTRLDDSPMDASTREQYRIYRQSLRELPQLYANNDVLSMNNVIWPQL
jgi:hypothetical protein